MVASLRSVAHASALLGGDPIVAKPAGATVGDWYAAECVNVSGAAVWTPPAGQGWVQPTGSLGGQAPLYVRQVDANDAARTDYTFAVSGSSNGIVTLACIKDAAGIEDVKAVLAGSGNVVIPAATSGGPDRFAWQMAIRLAATTFTPPGTASEAYDTQVGPANYTSAGGGETVGAGSTGSRTWVPASTGANVGYMLLFTPKSQTVSPSGFDLAVQFGTPTLIQDQFVNPAGFDLAVQFGTPTLIQDQFVNPAGFDLAVGFGAPGLQQTVDPDGFDLAVEFGAPTVVPDQFVTPDGFDLAVEFGTPALRFTVEPDGFDLAVEFGEPTIINGQPLPVEGFDLTLEFGTPVLALQPLVTGTVFDHETGAHVGAGVVVKLFDDNDELVDTTTTDADGAFVFYRPIGDAELYWTLATFEVNGVQYHGVSDRGCAAV